MNTNFASNNLPTAGASHAGVTELILADYSHAQLEMVLPMIVHLTQQQSSRWVTWITNRPLDKKKLLERGVNPKVFRILPIEAVNDLLWITWEALSLGTSHTVIVDAGRLSESHIAQLEQAARMGHCQCVILRSR